MGLNHVESSIRAINYENVFHDTWGHQAPEKNVTYRGEIVWMITEHSEYGSQPIILRYDFINHNTGECFDGAYLHTDLFDKHQDWAIDRSIKCNILYKQAVSWRNYRFYFSNPFKITQL